MTWTTRILAILNIIAIGVLFYAAGRSAYQRAAWTQFLEERAKKYRDGQTTQAWLASLNSEQMGKLLDRMEVTPLLLSRLPEADRAKIEALERAKKNQYEALKARGDKPPYRYKSESEQRQQLAKLAVNDNELDSNPGKLLTVGGDMDKMQEALGPAGFLRLVREAIALNKPKLLAEEQRLVEAKASLLRQKENFEKDIAKFTEEIARLEARLKDERDLRERMETENRARRSEITQLYAEIEEAMHARDVALGREQDMRRQLAEIQDRIGKTTARIVGLEKAIEAKENATKE